MGYKFYYPSKESPLKVIELPAENYPVEREVRHWDKISVAEDGTVKGTDRGVIEYFYTLRLGPLRQEKIEALEDFLLTVGFRARCFDWEDHLGNVRTMRFWETKLKKEEKAFNVFYVTIKLREEITDGGIPPT